MCLCIQNKRVYLELLVHLIFQHAYAISTFFKHTTNLYYDPLRAELCLFPDIYELSNIVQHTRVWSSQKGLESLRHWKEKKMEGLCRKSHVSV